MTFRSWYAWFFAGRGYLCPILHRIVCQSHKSRTNAKRCRKQGQIRAKAEQGDASEQYNLGVMYEKGQGVQQDYAKAYMWISLAADQGLEDAIKKLDYLVNILTPSQIEEGQRLAREWIATHTKAQATQ